MYVCIMSAASAPEQAFIISNVSCEFVFKGVIGMPIFHKLILLFWVSMRSLYYTLVKTSQW